MKTTATITREDPVPPATIVTLVMSGNEADTLGVILRKIAGHPDGRRGDCTRMLRALEEAGIAYHGIESPVSRNTDGKITFPTARDGGGC